MKLLMLLLLPVSLFAQIGKTDRNQAVKVQLQKVDSLSIITIYNMNNLVSTIEVARNGIPYTTRHGLKQYESFIIQLWDSFQLSVRNITANENGVVAPWLIMDSELRALVIPPAIFNANTLPKILSCEKRQPSINFPHHHDTTVATRMR